MSDRETNISSFEDLHYIRTVAEERLALLTYSIDGRSFSFTAPVSSDIPNGGYVVITTEEGKQFLGQVNAKELVVSDGTQLAVNLFDEMAEGLPKDLKAITTGEGITTLRIRAIEGQGIVLAALDDDHIAHRSYEPFARAHLEPASEEIIRHYQAMVTANSASLEIGRLQQVAPHVRVPALLRARGFNRHTFLCGQSGSGKTFALGVILEQLLLHTDLKIIVLDPNSDYVRLNDPRETVEHVNATRILPLSDEDFSSLSQRYGDILDQVFVFRPQAMRTGQDAALHINFSDLTIDEQAVLLELNPLREMKHFNIFTQIIEAMPGTTYTLDEVHRAVLTNSLVMETRELGLRIENLGIRNWEIWTHPGETSLTDVMKQDDWRCLIIDTGPLSSSAEQSVIAISILGHLWRERNQRQPMLIVIDEAHNICPHEPLDEIAALSTEACIRIAGEGRKFGLYLFLATQRPGKIHPNVLSQCDNLILMRMNSSWDLNHIRETLSFAPENLVNQAAYFGLGESLVAGNIVPNPIFAKFGGRFTYEGGADISSAWASPK